MIRALARRLDDLWCSAVLATVGDRPGLLSFLFHAVAADGPADDIDRCVDPTQTLSVSALEGFVAHFRRHGYHFVSPEEIREGLPNGGRYALITFDDGYFNNRRVLPLLEREGVPAVFFISTNHILTGRAFWWDVLYRERLRQGVPRAGIVAEQAAMKRLTHVEIDDYLAREFGPSALDPIGDEDRPMSLEELTAFARQPGVHLGNHTADHAILTNYSERGVRAQIEGAQSMLASVTGTPPCMVSYPNGNYSPTVMRVARDCGLDLGITVDGRRTGIPLVSEDVFRIGRYCFTRGFDDDRTYRSFRTGWSLRRLAAGARVRERPTRELSQA